MKTLTQTNQTMAPRGITPEQRASFDKDGFLVVPNALPPEMVDRLLEVTDRLYAEGLRAQGLSKTNHWQMRNCVVQDELFLELLDWPATFPLIVDQLGPNIQLSTSHLVVRAPSPPGVEEDWKAEGWHRDGGTSHADLAEPHPRFLIKIAYWLTDLSQSGRGNIRFVPGSNRLVGGLSWAKGAPDPYGAIEICAKPGDAVLFEQRTYHAVGPNRSEITRKSLFFGYAFRWIRPMDYLTMPPGILERCSPVRQQLLGDLKTPMGFYLPTEEDVPLRQWIRERDARTPVEP